MTKIIARINFSTNDESYLKGEEIHDLKYEEIVKLNEKGYIEPLKYEELILIKRELEKPKNKEERLWDLIQMLMIESQKTNF